MHCTAADAYGELVAARMSAGRPVRVLDGQIAAIARARRATVATRKVPDFDGCGVKVTQPSTKRVDRRDPCRLPGGQERSVP